jgi:hypothetical protein
MDLLVGFSLFGCSRINYVMICVLLVIFISHTGLKISFGIRARLTWTLQGEWFDNFNSHERVGDKSLVRKTLDRSLTR